MGYSIKERIKFIKNNGYCMVPQLMQIEITTRCPLKCPQCYKSLYDKKDFAFDNLYPILVEAAEIGVQHIMLNGGEPALYPEMDRLLPALDNFGFKTFAVFSGVGIDEKFIHQYLKYIKKSLSISISLNGSTKEIHSLSRDGYEYGLNAMNLLKEEDLPYGINWVVRKDNIDDFPNLIKLSREMKASSITVVLTKLDSKGNLPSKLDHNDIKRLADIINNTNALMNTNYIQAQYCFPLLNKLLKKFVNKNMNRCPAAYRSFYINIDGQFAPCSHMPHLSEKFTSLFDYWKNSSVLTSIRSNKMENENCINNCKDWKDCKNCYCMDFNSYQKLSLGLDNCPIIKLIND